MRQLRLISAVCNRRFRSSVHWDETVLWVGAVNTQKVGEIEEYAAASAHLQEQIKRETDSLWQGLPKALTLCQRLHPSSVTLSTLLPMAYFTTLFTNQAVFDMYHSSAICFINDFRYLKSRMTNDNGLLIIIIQFSAGKWHQHFPLNIYSKIHKSCAKVSGY